MFRSHQPHILFILADDYGWNDIGKERLLLNLILYNKITSTDGRLRPYVPCSSLKLRHWLLTADGGKSQNFEVPLLVTLCHESLPPSNLSVNG